MAATSVTGIGPGEAGNFQQGPDGGESRTVFRTLHEHHTCPFVERVGEFVAPAGEGGVSSRITLTPPAEGHYDNYLIVLFSADESIHPEVTTRANDSEGNFVSFDVISNTGDTVQFLVFFDRKTEVFTNLEV